MCSFCYEITEQLRIDNVCNRQSEYYVSWGRKDLKIPAMTNRNIYQYPLRYCPKCGRRLIKSGSKKTSDNQTS